MSPLPHVLVALALAACTGEIAEPAAGAPEGPLGTRTVGPTNPFATSTYHPNAADTQLYLSRIAPMTVGRVLTVDELDRIDAEGGDALVPVLEAWSTEPGYVGSARTLMETLLAVSGQADDADFDLPGNLVAHVVENDLPWSMILTADTCYDAAGSPITCDTGAPYTAGVLTTRAYMMSRAGRFNLTRAGTMMRTFACREYPIEPSLQPRLPKEMLIEMFRAESQEEQTNPEAAGGFGNGFACYGCHGQFSAHAQLFVKFDVDGHWQADATGQQNPDGQLGESFDGLMTSHLIDPERAASERSQIFGTEVDDLTGAADVLAHDRVFVECATRRLLEHTLDLDGATPVDVDLIDHMAERALERSADPTYGDIVVATLAHPEVVRATVFQLREASAGGVSP